VPTETIRELFAHWRINSNWRPCVLSHLASIDRNMRELLGISLDFKVCLLRCWSGGVLAVSIGRLRKCKVASVISHSEATDKVEEETKIVCGGILGELPSLSDKSHRFFQKWIPSASLSCCDSLTGSWRIIFYRPWSITRSTVGAQRQRKQSPIWP